MNKTLALLTGLVVSGTLMASTAPKAQALSLVPKQVGEVSVGATCPNLPPSLPSITLHPLISSVTSLVDSTTGTKSRLFVDRFVGGVSTIFGHADIGTNPDGYWFRPSECKNARSHEEGGQLEVGTFKFTFAKAINLKVNYFDTETDFSTGVLDINGSPINSFIPAGSNGNIQTQIWKNVSSITLKLGQDFKVGTGDGVDFQLEAIPEPSALAGLGMIGVGLLANRRRRKPQSV